MARTSDVPLIAAGGVGGPDDVAALMDAGAAMVQAGTALPALPRERAGRPGVQGRAGRAPALGDTAVARAFSGHRARAWSNAMVRGHPNAPAAYPKVDNATRPFRAGAARVGDRAHESIRRNGFPARREGPAGEVVEHLASGPDGR